MAPDALDGALKRIERSAGTALFVREEGRILPTDAGRSAMHTGERMAEEMARVDRVLPRVPPGPPVRVRVDETLAAHWLQTAATELARKLGNVTLELVTGWRGGAKAEVDLEITTDRSTGQGGSPRALGLITESLHASEAYLLDHGRPAQDRLVGHRLVLFSGRARTEAGRWLLEASRKGPRSRSGRTASRCSSRPCSGVGLGVLLRGSEEVAPSWSAWRSCRRFRPGLSGSCSAARTTSPRVRRARRRSADTGRGPPEVGTRGLTVVH
jgi:DNA-binding transcriptional LysR family regulator